jgi:hypothetical protein
MLLLLHGNSNLHCKMPQIKSAVDRRQEILVSSTSAQTRRVSISKLNTRPEHVKGQKSVSYVDHKCFPLNARCVRLRTNARYTT